MIICALHMELFFSSFPFLFTFFLFTVMVLKLGKRARSNGSISKLPPGPRKLPIIGNIHQLAGSLPNRRLRDLAKRYGPLMHLQLGEVSTMVVSSPEFAREFMKTHDITFASRPEILASQIIGYDSTNISFSPYSDYWRQIRKICMLELLSSKRVQSFRPVREEVMKDLIKWISSKAGAPINLTEKVFSSSYTFTSRAAFGKKCKEQDRFETAVQQSIELAAGLNLSDLYPSNKLLYVIGRMRAQRLHKEVDRILGDIVDEHRKSQGTAKIGVKEVNEDFVDVLLNYEQHGGLGFHITADNIKAVILDIYAAGSETTATIVTWAMSEMMKNPRVMEKAQAEVRQVFERKGCVDEDAFSPLEYLKLVIKETMRFHPPLPLLLPRECREKCKINGYEIPFKTKVLINAWAIGRDPSVWNDAEKFYPERFLGSSIDFKGTNFEYIPFGAGRRMCPGMTFGLVSVEFVLALLLYHFDWELPNGIHHQDLDMSESFGVTARRKYDLFAIPIPHKPSLME